MLEYRIESPGSFYETLVGWWNIHKFPVIPKESIPSRIFVVSVSGVDAYAVPVYVSDADFCWIGFPTSNKSVKYDKKEGALDYLLYYIEINMKNEGFNTMITTSDTPSLMELFKNNGYTESDQGTNYYTKRL